MRYRFRAIAPGIVLSLILSTTPCALGRTPKYIFLFIGDGMGSSQRELAERVSVQAGLGKLEMNHFPVCGKAYTNNVNNETTDSAAAGTALSCGVKTRNGMLGMTPDKQPVDNVTVDAQNAGWKVGDISSVHLNHATPAAFYAHVESRNRYEDIFAQAVVSGVDFFGGPGFGGTKQPVEKTLTDAGYEVSLGKIDPNRLPELPCAILASPTGNCLKWRCDCRDSSHQRTPETLSLADITRAAIRRLDNPTGFFIMIEGGAIDWACHGNNFPGTVWETIDMNDAVRVALEFYRRHPDDTLLIVTADHECGGLTIVREVKPERLLRVKSPDEVKTIVTRLAKHTPDGKTFIEDLRKAVGLDAIPAGDRNLILDLYAKNQLVPGKDKNNRNVTGEVIRLMNAQAGIRWTTDGHTGVAVPTTAVGAGSEAFRGEYENTHIAETIRKYIARSAEKKSGT